MGLQCHRTPSRRRRREHFGPLTCGRRASRGKASLAMDSQLLPTAGPRHINVGPWRSGCRSLRRTWASPKPTWRSPSLVAAVAFPLRWRVRCRGKVAPGTSFTCAPAASCLARPGKGLGASAVPCQALPRPPQKGMAGHRPGPRARRPRPWAAAAGAAGARGAPPRVRPRSRRQPPVRARGYAGIPHHLGRLWWLGGGPHMPGIRR